MTHIGYYSYLLIFRNNKTSKVKAELMIKENSHILYTVYWFSRY